MSVEYRKQQYYRTAEVCKMVDISRTTLWRWMKSGILGDSIKRDRRGWRLFTKADIKKIEDEAHKVI